MTPIAPSPNAREIGVGFWSMQNAYTSPRPLGALYQEAVDEVRLAEDLGFATAWTGEHHLSYDGYCPSPALVTSMWAAATRRIRLAIGVLVLPFHRPERARGMLATLTDLAPGRARVVVGIGYRPVEFEAADLAMRDRARLLEAHLDELVAHDAFRAIDLWIGGNSAPAVGRAARYGASLLFNETASVDHITASVSRYRDACAEHGHPPGRVGVVREAWVVDSADERADIMRRLTEMWRQYAQHWASGPGADGLRRRIIDKYLRTAIVADAAGVATELDRLSTAGIDTFALRLRFDALPTERARHGLRALADALSPDTPVRSP